MRWSEEPTWSLQRARILTPSLPFTFHFPTRHRAIETRALLIPSLLLTFNLSPATARVEPAPFSMPLGPWKAKPIPPGHAPCFFPPCPLLRAPCCIPTPSLLLTFNLSPATARAKPAPLVRLTGKFRSPCRRCGVHGGLAGLSLGLLWA
jgi:hypothetical protein